MLQVISRFSYINKPINPLQKHWVISFLHFDLCVLVDVRLLDLHVGATFGELLKPTV
jgi:hypothetical protein